MIFALFERTRIVQDSFQDFSSDFERSDPSKTTPYFNVSCGLRVAPLLSYYQFNRSICMLIIIDSNAKHRYPIPYWDKPSHHGCPPTKRRVELNEDNSVDIYNGDTHIHHLTVEEQKALRDA